MKPHTLVPLLFFAILGCKDNSSETSIENSNSTDALVGQWEITSFVGRMPTLVFDGEMGIAGKFPIEGSSITIKPEQMTWMLNLPNSSKGFMFWGGGGKFEKDATGNATVEQVCSFSVDNSTTPKRIDMITSLGKHKETLLGLFKVEGDTLTIVRPSKNTGEYPENFEVQESSHEYTLIVAKRVQEVK